MTAALLSQSVAPCNALESPHDAEEEEEEVGWEVGETTSSTVALPLLLPP
jgi:hypothetical protein